MLSLPPSVRIFVHREPTDMRKSFDGLSALVEGQLHEDPYSGHLFVFINRRQDRIKLLYWDRSGFWLFYKRLERGAFWYPPGRGKEIRATDLLLLLEGLDPRGFVERRYRREEKNHLGADILC